eukprot:IDg22484t1
MQISFLWTLYMDRRLTNDAIETLYLCHGTCFAAYSASTSILPRTIVHNRRRSTPRKNSTNDFLEMIKASMLAEQQRMEEDLAEQRQRREEEEKFHAHMMEMVLMVLWQNAKQNKSDK